jgi:hypothetical protein
LGWPRDTFYPLTYKIKMYKTTNKNEEFVNINTNIMFLDIIHRPVFIYKTTLSPVVFFFTGVKIGVSH